MSDRLNVALRVEPLEDRTTPATFGEGWLDGKHLTLSFATEGTLISGFHSSLSGVFASLGHSQGRLEILRAFQAWVARANLNIGLVGDSGASFETAGAVQGDPRFGDIRIGARPLAADVVALTNPSGPWNSSAGDIVINTQKAFALGATGADATYDLRTIMFQEAGHAFGIGNSPNITSVMYETFSGPRAGLSAEDVASVLALYGARAGDAYEGVAGNNTQATASALTGPIVADLTTVTDADWYSFTAPVATGSWIRLKAAGVSLVTARVEVFDADGQLVAGGESTDPQNNDVNVWVPGWTAGATYYVKVSSARTDDFGVGAYRLTVESLGTATPPDPYAIVDTESGLNDTQGTAATLTSVPAAVPRPGDFLARSSLAAAGDVDVFRVHSPAGTGTVHMILSVAGVGTTGLLPNVEVYTAAGTRLTAAVVSTSANHLNLTVSNLPRDTDFFVRVNSPTAGVGNYDVAVVFRTVLPNWHGSYGSLSQDVQSSTAEMKVYQSQVFRMTLSANGAISGDTMVWVTVFNASNQVVYRLATGAGQVDSGTLLLARGVYRVEVKVVGSDPTLPSLSYSLQMFGLTDPMGSSTLDPSPSPLPGGSDPGPAPGDGSTVTVDPEQLPPPSAPVTYPMWT
ncbi:MAG TPA: matrixin family metalloprotease [Gemmataceae bacterium]|nr:matrixin family metalloprotease [Gemmataceae bacterium]